MEHRFPQLVPLVSVKVRSAGKEASDIALIRFVCEGEDCGYDEPHARSCPLIGNIEISYVGERNCRPNKRCSPGELITFSIVPAEALQRSCPDDKIWWLFDDGSEPQDGQAARKAFGRSKPPHAVHLVVLRNGKVSTASTTVDVPLLKCKSCSGGK